MKRTPFKLSFTLLVLFFISSPVGYVDTVTESISTYNFNGEIYTVTFSPDGNSILAGGRGNNAKLWNIISGTLIDNFAHGSSGSAVTSVDFSPDGNFILTGSTDYSIRLWSFFSSEEEILNLGIGCRVFTISFSPDGTLILSGGENSKVVLWDINGGSIIKTFAGHGSQVNSVSFSTDGKKILTGSNDQTAILWDIDSGNVIQTFNEHEGNINSVTFSPDGIMILTGSSDNTAKLWDVNTGINILTFTGHANEVKSVAFSPDGNYILTGSSDKTAKLWNVEGRAVIRTFQHTDSVNSVAFSPDGQYILTGSSDSTAELWDISDLPPLSSPTPITTPIASLDLNGSDLDSNNLLLDSPEGFTQGQVNFGWIPEGEGTDGQGMTINLFPGQGAWIVSQESIHIPSGLAHISGKFQASDYGISIALMALNSPVDGQYAYTNLTGLEIPVGEYRQFDLFYSPPSERIQIALQAVCLPSSSLASRVWVDDLKIELPVTGELVPIALAVDGSFDHKIDKLIANMNDADGNVFPFFESLSDIAIKLSLEPSNLAANIGTVLTGISDSFPLDVFGSVSVRRESSPEGGGTMALVMTNGFQNIGTFRFVDEIPDMDSGNEEFVIVGGRFTVENPDTPIHIFIQNGGPDVDSTIVVDDLVVSKKIWQSYAQISTPISENIPTNTLRPTAINTPLTSSTPTPTFTLMPIATNMPFPTNTPTPTFTPTLTFTQTTPKMPSPTSTLTSTNTPIASEPITITGVVLAAPRNIPIPGALVNIGGIRNWTAWNGLYKITLPRPGNYPVYIQAGGYPPFNTIEEFSQSVEYNITFVSNSNPITNIVIPTVTPAPRQIEPYVPTIPLISTPTPTPTSIPIPIVPSPTNLVPDFPQKSQLVGEWRYLSTAIDSPAKGQQYLSIIEFKKNNTFVYNDPSIGVVFGTYQYDESNGIVTGKFEKSGVEPSVGGYYSYSGTFKGQVNHKLVCTGTGENHYQILGQNITIHSVFTGEKNL